MARHQTSMPAWKRNLLLLGCWLIAVFLTWQIINQANGNYRLEQEADRKKAENQLLQVQIKHQREKNTLLRSPYQQALGFRDQTGKVPKGENLNQLNIDRHAINQLREDYLPQEAEAVEQPQLSTWQEWQELIFGSQNNNAQVGVQQL